MAAGRYSTGRCVSLGLLMGAGVASVASLAAQAPAATLLAVLSREKAGPVLGIIDPVAGKIVARVPVGPDPHIVTTSDDGTLAFVANTNGHGTIIPEGDSISVIDIAARKEIRRIPVGNGTRPSDVELAGGNLYFTAGGYKALGRYDMKRQKTEFFGLGQGGPDAFAFSKDLNTVYAANPDTDTISVVKNVLTGPLMSFPPKPSDWEVDAVVHVGKGLRPEDIQVSPDGKEVWTVNEAGGNVSIINVATRQVQNVDVQTKHAVRMRFTPNGRHVLLLDRDLGETVVVDAASRKVVKRIKFTSETPGVPMSNGNLVVEPDGSRAYVSVSPDKGGAERDFYIAVIDLKTLAVTNKIPTYSYANGLAWAAPK